MLTGSLPGFVINGELLLAFSVEPVPFYLGASNICGSDKRPAGQRQQAATEYLVSNCKPAMQGPFSSNYSLLSHELFR